MKSRAIERVLTSADMLSALVVSARNASKIGVFSAFWRVLTSADSISIYKRIIPSVSVSTRQHSLGGRAIAGKRALTTSADRP